MNNVLFALCLLFLSLLAMLIGAKRESAAAADPARIARTRAPHIGSVQVLNGCGQPGAARVIADYLRDKGSFDVKNTGNAPTANYPFTIVVSRTSDTRTAQQIARVLRTDKLVVMRSDESLYEVDVFVGADYQERTP